MTIPEYDECACGKRGPHSRCKPFTKYDERSQYRKEVAAELDEAYRLASQGKLSKGRVARTVRGRLAKGKPAEKQKRSDSSTLRHKCTENGGCKSWDCDK